MFTPTKIIVLVLILFFVWSIFKMVEKRDNLSRETKKNSRKTTSVDLEQCSVCKSWVDVPCNEADCPIKS